MEGLYGIDTGIDTEQLADLTRYVQQVTGVPMSAFKAVVSENVFAQELEIHVRVTARDHSMFEPFSPDLVGHRRTLKLGRGTGPTGATAKLAELGLEALEEQARSWFRWAMTGPLRTRRPSQTRPSPRRCALSSRAGRTAAAGGWCR